MALGLAVNAQRMPSFKTIKNDHTTRVKAGAANSQLEQKARSLKKEPFFSAAKQSKSISDLKSAHQAYVERSESIKANKNVTVPKLSVRKSATPDAATVTLTVVGDPYADSSGFQMFLDPDCEFNWQNVWYYDQFFQTCEYHIPEDATSEEDLSLTSVVLDGSGSITVPQGPYNFVILNILTSENRAVLESWAGTWNYAVADNFYFKNGYEYIFTMDFDHVSYSPEHDAALVGLTVPEPSPDLTGNESITVKVTNRGAADFSSVDLSYQLNDGNIVTETYNQLIQVGEEKEYTFNTKADFSAGGIYNVKAWVTYENDLDSRNDLITASTKHTSTIKLPFISQFNNPAEYLYWTEVNSDGNVSRWIYDRDNTGVDGNIGSVQVYSLQHNAAANNYFVSDPLNFANAGNYNIRFQFRVFGDESLRILCGTTPDPLEMDTVAYYPLLRGHLWDFRPINFTVSESGTHYVAFQYCSQPAFDPDPSQYGEEGETVGGTGMNIDNIIVDTGIFIGIPDLEVVKVMYPASACDMVDSTSIRVRLKNIGTEPISNITLKYQINGGDVVKEVIPYSEWYLSPIGINDEVTVAFDGKYDFSELGEYTVRIIGETDDDKNNENDTFTTTVIHYEPLTAADLPFVSDFMNPEDRKEWSSNQMDGWLPNADLGCLWPETVRIPLLSRCITLEPGTYRFDYGYSAGWEILGMLFIDNFYIAYGKAGEDPLRWTPVKSYENMATYGTVIDDDIILNITEAGDYVVAVVPTVLGDLAIWHTSISEVKAHDVKTKNIYLTESLPRIIPKAQFTENKIIPVTVANRGLNTESGSLTASVNSVSIGQTDFYVEPYKDTVVLLTVNLAELPVGEVNISITADIEDDGAISDNTVSVTKIISDSVFAFDNANNLSWGFGTTSAVKVGLVYELSAPDTLTSISVAFLESNYDVNFGLAVYPVTNDSIGEAYFSIQQHNISGVSHAYDVPDTILQPGKYFFEIKDLSVSSFYLVSDMDAYGYFYARNGESPQLERVSGIGLGYVHVRPNFASASISNSNEHARAFNDNVFIYPNPSTGEFTVAVSKTSTVDIFNTVGKKIITKSVSGNANFSLKQSGVYMVRVTAKDGKNIVTKKIIVK